MLYLGETQRSAATETCAERDRETPRTGLLVHACGLANPKSEGGASPGEGSRGYRPRPAGFLPAQGGQPLL